MTITGQLLVGSARVTGDGPVNYAFNPATGEQLEPGYAGASLANVDRACQLAEAAFDSYRAVPLERRAAFLDAVAQAILDVGEELVERCMAETGLPRPRIEGERARTVNQMRLFAGVVRSGGFLDVRIDPALPDRQPLPRPDLRLRQIPVGPVAVFGASNFPLAFSVGGGDTASALAAGCPVVVKAHAAHPGTSELVGLAIQKAVTACGLPEGVFSMVFGPGAQIGQALVADSRIKAVGFTGSRGGGTALMQTAAARREPIPVYAEMSSINPVVMLSGALNERAEATATQFVASLTLGAGQFCTNPGLIIAVECEGLSRFMAAAAEALAGSAPAVMLTAGIHRAYCEGVHKLSEHDRVKSAGQGQIGTGLQGTAALFTVAAEDFIGHRELQDEVFGAASLVVRCRDLAQVAQVLESLEGQLTAAVHVADSDLGDARALMPLLERKAGRILFNGYGTGVEVAHAMVHGGPYPSTADGRSTSVGSLAIQRFLRPVCYQDLPQTLAPPELQDANPLDIPRLMDGRLSLA